MAKVRAMLASSKVFQPPTSWRHYGALLTARTQSQGRLFSWSLFWSSFCLSLVYLWESDCLKSHPLKNEISPLTAYLSKWLSRRWRVMSICPAPPTPPPYQLHLYFWFYKFLMFGTCVMLLLWRIFSIHICHLLFLTSTMHLSKYILILYLTSALVWPCISLPDPNFQ